jgi:hypothetical protein
MLAKRLVLTHHSHELVFAAGIIMRSFSLLLPTGLMLAGVVSVASAEEAEIITAPDPAVIVEIAKGFGSAKIDKDDNGDPMVSGRIQGLKYSVWFYGCENHEKCTSIQFAAGYSDDFTAEQANEWNKKYRWVKSFAGDGSNFRMDVSFRGGITRANLEEQFSNWDSMTSDIKEFVNEK